jgi:hypothetical protein
MLPGLWLPTLVVTLLSLPGCDPPRRGGAGAGGGEGEGEGEGFEGEGEGAEGEGAESEGAEGEGAEGEGAEGEGAEGEGAEGEGAEGEGEGIAQNQLALYKSGSRLKAVVGRTPDGAQAWLGWWDDDLGIDCTFQLTDDGEERCIPTRSNGQIQYFTDPGCSQPLYNYYEAAPRCEQDEMIAIWGSSVELCKQTVVVYENDGVFSGEFVYYNNNGTCMSYNRTDFQGWGFIRLGARIPLDRFVPLTRTVLEP